LGVVAGFESPRQVLLGFPGQGVVFTAGSEFPAKAFTVHPTWMNGGLPAGKVVIVTWRVSKPFVKGKATV
jgi:hypothetical protein